MRIKRHDVPIKVYDVVMAKDTDGLDVPTLVYLYAVNGDSQPLNNPAQLREYGIQPGAGRKLFVDLATDIPLNTVAEIAGSKFQAIQVDEWYDHAEVICKRYEG
jgi:hypothetical protein